MSEFHRMITYLYLYERGIKSHNTGFAKIEKRDNHCLIEIHMKNTGYSISPIPVYFYAQKQTHFPGILVGNMSISRGNGDFKAVLEADDLADSGYALESVKGIYIPLSQQVMFVSQWDDDEFVRENFIEAEKLSEKKELPETSMEKPSHQTTAAFRCPSAPVSSSSKTEERSVPVSSSSKTGERSAPVSSSSKTGERSVPASSNLKAAEAAPKIFETSERDDSDSHNSEQNHADIPENWNLKWNFILENYPVMTPFAGDENTLCVRLELKDLRLLPRQYWYLGNNSFLLHGFFNYRYLILGMTEESGRKKWFLGIPGVFQNPERVMASLFGFPEFRNEKSLPVNTGEFGYWYRYLDE